MRIMTLSLVQRFVKKVRKILRLGYSLFLVKSKKLSADNLKAVCNRVYYYGPSSRM